MDNLIGKTLDGLYTVRELIGTGGMATKLRAAQMATAAGCEMVIANGQSPEVLYDVAAGKRVGTRFLAKRDEA